MIVSEDTDFGALLARRDTPLPSLILLRTADPLTPEDQASLIVRELPLVEADLARGAILVLGRARARLRLLPIAGRQPSRIPAVSGDNVQQMSVLLTVTATKARNGSGTETERKRFKAVLDALIQHAAVG